MRIHFQRSIHFCLLPRVRIYRRPWLIWLRWFEKSAYIDGSMDWLCIRNEGRKVFRWASMVTSHQSAPIENTGE